MAKDTSWMIDDGLTTMVVDGLEGTPDFTVGREISLTLVFQGNNDATYNTLREYAEFLYDGSVEYGTDYRDVPYFKQYNHPQAPVQDFLWKVTPSEEISGFKGWWVVVTDIDDQSLFSSTPSTVSTTVVVVAPADEGDRAAIKSRYEV